MAPSPDAEETLTAFDGLKLHVETFDATAPMRAAVVMIHGFSAHCGLFRHVLPIDRGVPSRRARDVGSANVRRLVRPELPNRLSRYPQRQRYLPD